MNLLKMDKKFRVVFVSAVANFKGGAETCLKQFMDNPSVEPILILPEKGELSDYAEQHLIHYEIVDFGGVNKIRRPLKITQLFGAFFDAFKAGITIKQIAKKLNADLIHSNGLKTHGILSLASLFCKTPVICHIHDIPYTAKEKKFWRLLAAFNSKIILVSKYCWPDSKLPSNVKIIPNGITIEKNRLEEHLISQPVHIGFIGRIHPNKGLHIAIEWISLLKDKGVDFKFYIRGEAAIAEHEYVCQIRKNISQLGLTNHCFFEGRKNNYKDVYADLDITLMPSIIAEPFGLVAIESFDQGLPCFAYPSGALPSIIDHGISGYLCSTKEEFLESFNQLISSSKKYNEIRNSAHKTLQQNFSVATVYKNLSLQYASITSHKSNFEAAKDADESILM